MSERKLATIEQILAVDEIVGADKIEAVTVRGWKVVAKKNQFNVGDYVVYFEIDSALDITKPQFAFLAGKNEKQIDGKWYHVLRTAKFCGQVSQGLVIPTVEFSDVPFQLNAGEDVTDVLGIIKYEKPIPGEAGNITNAFPTWLVKKTDSERVQNLTDAVLQDIGNRGVFWTPTEKIDGQSVTYWVEEDGLHAASRNWELRRPEAGETLPTIWRVAQELDLVSQIPAGDVIQGELYGEGIQSNPLGIKGNRYAVFNTSVLPSILQTNGIEFAPHYDLEFPKTVQEAVEQVDGIKSNIIKERLAEGVVWTNVKDFAELGNRNTFKAINNRYLAKAKD